MWVASLGLLVALVVLYNVRTRALHRHAPYLDLWEWLLWSGLALFGLVLDGVRLRVRVHRPARDPRRSGLGVLFWVRFLRFPPILEAYEQRLAKQRYYTKTKFAHPEATIRPKAARRARR